MEKWPQNIFVKKQIWLQFNSCDKYWKSIDFLEFFLKIYPFCRGQSLECRNYSDPFEILLLFLHHIFKGPIHERGVMETFFYRILAKRVLFDRERYQKRG